MSLFRRRKPYQTIGQITAAIRTAFRMHPEWRPDSLLNPRGRAENCICAVEILALVNDPDFPRGGLNTCYARSSLIGKNLLTMHQFEDIYVGWDSFTTNDEAFSDICSRYVHSIELADAIRKLHIKLLEQYP